MSIIYKTSKFESAKASGGILNELQYPMICFDCILFFCISYSFEYFSLDMISIVLLPSTHFEAIIRYSIFEPITSNHPN